MVSSTVLTTLITLLLLPHPIHSSPTGTPLKRSDSLPFFTGRGLIHVLNSTDLTTASPTANIIGCLDQHGQLVTASTLPSQCALFTRADALPNVLSTSAGNCSFLDPSTPQNKDSIYGRNTHAWWCGGSAGDGSGGLEYYYTLNGLNFPFICNGNLDCYYDILDVQPAPGVKPLPVWQFFWGSQQFDVPAGHTRAVWLWVPVSTPVV